MTTWFAVDYLNEEIKLGDTIVVSGIEFIVNDIMECDPERWPNLHKLGIGAWAMLQRGKRGKKVYQMALRIDSTPTNGVIHPSF